MGIVGARESQKVCEKCENVCHKLWKLKKKLAESMH